MFGEGGVCVRLLLPTEDLAAKAVMNTTDRGTCAETGGTGMGLCHIPGRTSPRTEPRASLSQRINFLKGNSFIAITLYRRCPSFEKKTEILIKIRQEVQRLCTAMHFRW